jgi:hypothetical protein
LPQQLGTDEVSAQDKEQINAHPAIGLDRLQDAGDRIAPGVVEYDHEDSDCTQRIEAVQPLAGIGRR